MPSVACRPAAASVAIRVFLAEDHAITLWGLQRLIEGAAPRMQLVGTATSRTGLLEHPALAEADVLVLDLDLGGDDAAESMAAIQRRCRGHVLVLTGADDLQRHRAVVFGGARGVLHKSEPAATILQAIEKVHAGEVWLNRGLIGDVLGRLTSRNAPSPDQSPLERAIASLTPREREIVARLSERPSDKLLAVAESLSLSEHTLRNHLTTIYAKLGVRGRLALHVFASEHGLAGGAR
jgi:DNA-binding NarL/FixJ family response regulator